MDFDLARFNMVEQQIRPWGVLNPDVLAAFMAIKREEFVPIKMKNIAFSDCSIPLPCQQHMLNPKIEGRLLQAADIKKTDHVLIIGAGSGHLAALASQLSKQVIAVEIQAELASFATSNIARANIKNVDIQVGNAANGWKSSQSWDAVIATGAYKTAPPYDEIRKQLSDNARFVFVSGTEPVMHAYCIKNSQHASLERVNLFETILPYLVCDQDPAVFKL